MVELGDERRENGWKLMLFSQPPVTQLGLLQRSDDTVYMIRQRTGITMLAILNILDLMFHRMNLLQYPDMTDTFQEIEIMLSLQDMNGSVARNPRGVRICRALDTRLKIQFATL